MNSEEIKEIGQMFLNISNQNHSMNLGLTDEDIIKGVTNQMEEKLQEFKKNFTQELREASANVTPRLKKLEELHDKVESELKDLRNNSRIKGEGFEKLKHRIQTALLDPFEKLREEVLDLQKLATRTSENFNSFRYQTRKDLQANDANGLGDRVKELGGKVGKFGNQVGGYGGLISTLQRNYGERTAELNKIRKDYRELQDEMWERFKLVEAWIETKDSADKDRIRLEILENGHTDKSEQKKQDISGTKKAALEVLQRKANAEAQKNAVHKSAEEFVEKNKWLNWETSTSFAWKKIPISKLNNVSVRAHNALIEGGYRHIGNLLTESPYDLIQVPNFGRKCLREVMNALEEKNLTLNMQKFTEQKELRNSKDNTQRGNLYGFKS